MASIAAPTHAPPRPPKIPMEHMGTSWKSSPREDSLPTPPPPPPPPPPPEPQTAPPPIPVQELPDVAQLPEELPVDCTFDRPPSPTRPPPPPPVIHLTEKILIFTPAETEDTDDTPPDIPVISTTSATSDVSSFPALPTIPPVPTCSPSSPPSEPAPSGPTVLHKKTRGRQSSNAEIPRGRSVSAQPPLPVDKTQQRPHRPRLSTSVAGRDPRSHSAHPSISSTNTLSPQVGSNSHRRRSWLPGRSRSNSQEPPPLPQAAAWILSADAHIDYNVGYLVNGERVPELWDDNGSLLVYLYSAESGHDASFRVQASVIEDSLIFTSMVQAPVAASAPRSRTRSFGGRDSLLASDAMLSPTVSRTSIMPVGADVAPDNNVLRLYMPILDTNTTADAMANLEPLMALRNLFALLTGQPLVGTRETPTVFAALLSVAALLREYEFGSGSGLSFGEAVDVSLSFFVTQSALADVRASREKTLEALVLGEQLRFVPLYNEAFSHAVGKYPAMRELMRTSPLWPQVSTNTRQRLERAHLDLLNRQHSVNTRLEQFEFPSLFAGVANSTSNEDYRMLRFKNWRASFADMRSFVLKHYKSQFGSWPPKASSRRNPFTESGLNRMVLRTLYTDLCAVYDLLVDRSSVTPRVNEEAGAAGEAAGSGWLPDRTASPTAVSPAHRLPEMENAMKALRQILSEFDQSSPPVLPPMPYDTPLLPSMAAVRENYAEMAPKDQARFDKGLQPAELQQVMLRSHNPDAEVPETSSFLAAFEAFELHEARRKSNAELAEMRVGYWLFLYVVLQSMPMLVIDAPGLNFDDGVEYFLCEPSQGRPPWVEDAGEVRKAWFQTAGGAGHLVELSADVLLYSVEATYHRSHCWVVAKKWETEAADAAADAAAEAMRRMSMGQVSLNRTSLTLNQANTFDSGGMTMTMTSGPGTPNASTPDFATPRMPAADVAAMASASASVPDLPRLRCSSISGGQAPVLELAGSAAPPVPVMPAVLSEVYDRNESLDPLSPTETIGTVGTGGTTSTPTTMYSSNSETPPLQMHAASLAGLTGLPMPQARSNYLRLQQRADLRRASIGWALEPVKLSEGDAMGCGRSAGMSMHRPQQSLGLAPPSANARRIVSAGNLRMLDDANGTGAGSATEGSGSSSGSDKNDRPGDAAAAASSSTFDAILGTMEDKEKKKKRRMTFLPFS